MAKLTRDKFVILIDTTFGAESGTYELTRVDKSTIFELSFNPNEETFSYIDSPNDTTEVTGYSLELPQEIILDNKNALYSKLFPKIREAVRTGEPIKAPSCAVYPDTSTGEATDADMFDEATISPQTLNTVDGKLSFTIKLNGTPKKGTVDYSMNKWTFSPTE